MNKVEAIDILTHKIAELKTLPYEEFQNWLRKKHIEAIEVRSQTGKFYQIEVQAVLEDPEKLYGNLKVISSINDSHMVTLTGYAPIVKEFVIRPDNTVI